MRLVQIDSLADPRVSEYANMRDVELRHRTDPAQPVMGSPGLFMAEGELVVRRLIAAAPRFRTRSLLTTATRLTTLSEFLSTLPDTTPVYLVSQQIMNGIVGFNMHRGVLAVGQTEPDFDADQLTRSARLLLVLEDLVNHDNVGGIFRNAAALGGPSCGILLSPRCADPLYRKSLRVSVGHVLTVPFARLEPWPDGLEQLRALGWRVVALSPAPQAMDIDELADQVRHAPDSPRLALLLGTEGPGLSREAMAAADVLVRIPIAPSVDSLNVSVTAAIALHRLAV